MARAKKRRARGAEGAAAAEQGVERRARGRVRVASVPDVQLPRWVPPVLFAMLTLMLFSTFVFSSRMLFGADTITLGYMAREFYAEAVRAGDFPLWNPYLLGGVPFLEALSGGDSLYPTALLLFLMEPYRALGWKLVLHVFVAGLFMYGWTRQLGASRGAAVVAGTGWLLAPVMVTLVYPGHDGKLFVTALTPLLFWAMEATFGPRCDAQTGVAGMPLARRLPLAYAGVAGVVALVVLTTHFQMAYFLFGAAGLYYAFRCVEQARAAEPEPQEGARLPRWRMAGARFAIFLVASVVGAAAAGVQLIPSMGYVTDFSRRTATTTAASPELNKEYAAQWSLHPEEVAAMVVPEFVGNSAGGADWTTGTYWGRNFFKLNHEYAGLVVLLLAGASFFGARRRALRIFLAALGLAGLLYALGAHTPVWHLAYALLPGIRLFRAASMVSFLFSFSAVTLAAFGVDRLIQFGRGRDPDGARRVMRFLWIATGLLGGGLLLAGAGVLDDLWTGLFYRDITPDKAAALEALQPFLVRGFLVATVLAAGTSAVAWAATGGRLPASALVAGLTVLVAVDLWRVDAPFIQTNDPRALTEPDPIVAELLRRQTTEPPFRVHMVTADQEVGPATFGIALVGGHHPNDLARYRELIGSERGGAAVNLLNPNVLGVLAVQYLIWPTAEQGGEPPGLEVVARSSGVGGEVYRSLLRYPGLPRARLVGAAEIVPEERAVARILDPTFDVAGTVTLPEPPPIELTGEPEPGTVTWVENGLDRQRFTVDARTPALLVVADNWYPAWRATVDGAEAPVLRANHSLRAVPVAPGRHEIEMWYDAAVLRGGMLSSVAGLLALAGMAALGAALGRRRESEPA